jgi:hypothetical protein
MIGARPLEALQIRHFREALRGFLRRITIVNLLNRCGYDRFHQDGDGVNASRSLTANVWRFPLRERSLESVRYMLPAGPSRK